MATIVELDGVRPTISDAAWIAPTAVLIGDVRIAAGTSVWFGAVLRGDNSYIEIGAGCSVQDNVVIHCAHDLPTVIGEEVTLGHGAILEGCVVEDGALVGMGSIVCQHARVERGAMLAAGSVLSERATIGAGMLGAGVPAREKKPLEGVAAAWTRDSAREYQRLSDRYRRLATTEGD